MATHDEPKVKHLNRGTIPFIVDKPVSQSRNEATVPAIPSVLPENKRDQEFTHAARQQSIDNYLKLMLISVMKYDGAEDKKNILYHLLDRRSLLRSILMLHKHDTQNFKDAIEASEDDTILVAHYYPDFEPIQQLEKVDITMPDPTPAMSLPEWLQNVQGKLEHNVSDLEIELRSVHRRKRISTRAMIFVAYYDLGQQDHRYWRARPYERQPFTPFWETQWLGWQARSNNHLVT